MVLGVILTFLVLSIWAVTGFVEPISIKGRHFYGSQTNQPFFIKGVDYQPGGSSGVSGGTDPLSDPESCARDIALFQDLGINTIRVYSINPNLNHDKCMTLLAIAGIYLVLDVNSPLKNQHLNRYEPWSTYNELYAEHVFKVVQEFAAFNNTLAFFAGNEIVNDRISAKASPIFIKALVRDMKAYMANHIERIVPVGYSAADDLLFRTSLPDYLQCDEGSGEDTSIDFYGVNSYQWCGKQTMQSSGYDILVKDYENFPKPVFLSEYGCNTIRPRGFQEVETIYSSDMTHIFSGGLVYEFHQEANEYGLIKYDSYGNVRLLPDFHSLRKSFSNLQISYDKGVIEKEINGKKGFLSKEVMTKATACDSEYENIVTDSKLPDNPEIRSMIETGVVSDKGKFVLLTKKDLSSKFKVFDVNNIPYGQATTIKIADSSNQNREEITTISSDSSEKKKKKKSKNVIMKFFFKNDGSEPHST
ncbi:1,3-beta-glucanosyltransferase [Saccharomycopsis crataegensis]|uniref:1,3-beta-glucanosyltransferase n=1 Tax=Saccharomycopsis crataegensis TaxID=43959 RepID=A0AAV5QVH0_9ASCO|nr:1,3-beta-glucanosyltransferase [Saccharomycopsis crataegensis]